MSEKIKDFPKQPAEWGQCEECGSKWNEPHRIECEVGSLAAKIFGTRPTMLRWNMSEAEAEDFRQKLDAYMRSIPPGSMVITNADDGTGPQMQGCGHVCEACEHEMRAQPPPPRYGPLTQIDSAVRDMSAQITQDLYSGTPR